MSRYRVAMDIGGTFTDFVVVDAEAGQTSSGKVRRRRPIPPGACSRGCASSSPT